VGELNLDLVLYRPAAEFELDREHLASDLRITLGSSSAIFAHNFALLANRLVIARLETTQWARTLFATPGRKAESSVDVSFVKRFPLQNAGLTVISLDR
jgi:hypothetical protein